MIVHNIMLGLSIIISLLIYFLTGQYLYWYCVFLLPLYYVAAYFLLIVLYIIFITIVAWFLNKKKVAEKPNKFFYGVIRETAILSLFFSRCKVKKINMNLEPKKKRYLVVSNHKSNYDPIILFKCLKEDPIICVTKPEIFDYSVVGRWVRYSGFIPIVRDDIYQSIEAINTASKYIKENKASICIYPEGKRNYNDELLDFHPGSFKIAYKAKCPIIIASTKNSMEIKKNFPFKRTKVTFKIIEVLEYEDYKDKSTSEIAKYAKNLIEEDLKAGQK